MMNKPVVALTQRLYTHDQEATARGHARMPKDSYISAQGPTPKTTVANSYKSGYEDENGGSRGELEEGYEREGRAKLYIRQAGISGVK